MPQSVILEEKKIIVEMGGEETESAIFFWGVREAPERRKNMG